MGKCIVEVCSNRGENVSNRNDKISFFHFPKNPKREADWVNRIGRDPHWIPAKGTRICSIHFQEKFLLFNKNNRRYLSPEANPTINLPKMFNDISTQTEGSPISNDLETSTSVFEEASYDSSSRPTTS